MVSLWKNLPGFFHNEIKIIKKRGEIPRENSEVINAKQY